jgi:hypothetical protein
MDIGLEYAMEQGAKRKNQKTVDGRQKAEKLNNDPVWLFRIP